MTTSTLTEKDKLVLKGIETGGRAYTGPYGLQIGVTGHCNLNCVFCAPFSYRRPGGPSRDRKSMRLGARTFDGLVDDAARLGVEQISLVGAGEPFTHPDIMPFIRRVKELGMRCMVTTNGSTLTRANADEMIEKGLDILNVSLNAASEETHAVISGRSNGKIFERVIESLEYMSHRKKDLNAPGPWLSLRFVMTSLNEGEIESFYAAAARMGADEVVFQNYVPPAFAHDISLGPEGKRRAVDALMKVSAMASRDEIKTNAQAVISRYSGDHGGSGAAVFMGYEVSDGFHRKHPCLTGWTYAMALADGAVMPCCYCWSPMGNLNEQTFEKIWFGEEYNAFRRRTINLPRNGQAPPNCKCFDNCGSIPDNIRTMRRLGIGAEPGKHAASPA